jgi:hypothetical protein
MANRKRQTMTYKTIRRKLKVALIPILKCYFVLFFCFVFDRLVHLMLPVSLDCPFVTDRSVFSNVYLENAIDITKMLP